MLHTLFHSPTYSDIESLTRLLMPEDDLLLLQDGVLAAIEGSRALEQLRASGAKLWALEDDLNARGLSTQISPVVQSVDYTFFVALTVKHQQQMAW
ncbi:tRNA 2-thiouridine synthesizing protein B [Pantoea sp. PNA 14-12]|uniref:sulfurtransferase complex subunit TusB n=1 Tax=Pantoea TaxID=53335 RepID=UPI00050F6447|nr:MULTISPECIES: sulfurtransferase complex subunit TusB [Pantoea]KGD81830.1 sulfur transfer complex subunit TusB [Pantoea stewartii subsp. indologenes]KHE00229.1 sulfur transfer complex subunit TusB [Pantoea stewartii]KHN59956.1 sulfur transfer complex subunit TusB [Pantoea stewartii]KTS29078.1 sulfur transfer complex subunit TusB [Pantoea stewartii]MBC0856160.1 sulfurtransferase complex subunit TusB [Pantoea stewartii]